MERSARKAAGELLEGALETTDGSRGRLGREIWTPRHAVRGGEHFETAAQIEQDTRACSSLCATSDARWGWGAS